MLRFVFSLAWLVCLSTQSLALDADIHTVENIATELGFTPSQRWSLYQGKIVATDLPEPSANMLAQVVALVLPVGVEALDKRLQGGHILETPRDVIAFGVIDPKNPLASFASVPFFADELESLQDGEYDGFNLSAEEITTLKAEKNKPIAAVEAAYRRILGLRAQAYIRQGLSGVQAYWRSDGKTSRPQHDLKIMTAAIPLLATHEPAFYRAFLAYPKQQIPGVKTDFFWIKKWADDRPVFTLAHRMIKAEPDRMLVVRREFYVGHSFNAEQWVAGFFPLPQGTIFFSVNLTSSDQLQGFGSELRHAIGRDMMRNEIVERFNNLRGTLGH
ncbi:MAG: hypothetical protein M0R33_10910 [Methylomonas sp.]|jgi:hypothetical protein|uniref:hypothetical protein n=1 Tax=Methylomonas sp. TaxID=418 RepID=UPI0025EA9AC3|nr:hypothetical protein [Methylomonas sp.]MCK9606941.1 hypothetical protein [Methylomonas sp.]